MKIKHIAFLYALISCLPLSCAQSDALASGPAWDAMEYVDQVLYQEFIHNGMPFAAHGIIKRIDAIQKYLQAAHQDVVSHPQPAQQNATPNRSSHAKPLHQPEDNLDASKALEREWLKQDNEKRNREEEEYRQRASRASVTLASSRPPLHTPARTLSKPTAPVHQPPVAQQSAPQHQPAASPSQQPSPSPQQVTVHNFIQFNQINIHVTPPSEPATKPAPDVPAAQPNASPQPSTPQKPVPARQNMTLAERMELHNRTYQLPKNSWAH